ncbi:cation transporter dimerization domain-containing protein, partial [Marinomonas sp.]
HVPSHASVSEGHFLGELVSYTIRKAHPQVVDVLVHIDPEEDFDEVLSAEGAKPEYLKRPARHQVLADLRFLLRQHTAYLNIDQTRLHYLADSLDIELVADSSKLPEDANLQKVTQAIYLDIQAAPYAKKVDVLWSFPRNDTN